jgi:hypothetical protein
VEKLLVPRKMLGEIGSKSYLEKQLGERPNYEATVIDRLGNDVLEIEFSPEVRTSITGAQYETIREYERLLDEYGEKGARDILLAVGQAARRREINQRQFRPS